MSTTMAIRCHCGQAQVELRGEPVARAYCHCQSCRAFYATAVLSATAWPPEAVQVRQGQVASFAHPAKNMSRTFCPACGDTLFGTNRLGMRVVPNPVVARAAGGELPPHLAPTMHLFYRHRIVDVADGLTKYLEGWDGPRHDTGQTG